MMHLLVRDRFCEPNMYVSGVKGEVGAVIFT